MSFLLDLLTFASACLLSLWKAYLWTFVSFNCSGGGTKTYFALACLLSLWDIAVILFLLIFQVMGQKVLFSSNNLSSPIIYHFIRDFQRYRHWWPPLFLVIVPVEGRKLLLLFRLVFCHYERRIAERFQRYGGYGQRYPIIIAMIFNLFGSFYLGLSFVIMKYILSNLCF